MHRLGKFNFDSIFEYLVVILCILCSGAVLYQNFNRIILISSTLFLFLLCGYKLYKNRDNLSMSKINVTICLFMILYLTSAVVHAFSYGSNFFGEMGKMTQFVFSLLACFYLSSKSFFQRYNKVLFFLAVSSVILYLIPFVFSDFPKLFPIIKDYAGSKFYHAILFCYPTYMGKFYRNQSIFWESGAFQAFLNLALFIELYLLKNDKKKRNIHIFAYVIAIIFTKSTTGYLVLFLLILGKLRNLKTLGNQSKELLYAFAPIFFIFFSILFKEVVINKFSPSSLSFVSFQRRFLDSIIDIRLLFSNFFHFLFGVGEEKYLLNFTKLLNDVGFGVYTKATSSNSITAFMAQYGILSSFFLFFLYIKSFLSIEGNVTKLIFALMIIFCLMTENFIMAPIFLMVVLKLPYDYRRGN